MREHVAIPLTSDLENASEIAEQMDVLACKNLRHNPLVQFRFTKIQTGGRPIIVLVRRPEITQNGP